MKKDNIEEIYSELEGYSIEPPEELWDGIEARLHPKKKKKRGLFFLWGSAAAVVVLLLAYLFNGVAEFNEKPIKEITDIEYRNDEDTLEESEVRKTQRAKKTLLKVDSLLQVPNHTKELTKGLTSNKPSEKSEILKKNEHGITTKNSASKTEKLIVNAYYSQQRQKENSLTGLEKTALMSHLKHKPIKKPMNGKWVVNIDAILKILEIPSSSLPKEPLALNLSSEDNIDIKTVASLKWSVEVLGGLSNTASESAIQGASVNTTSQNDFIYALKLGYSISDRLIVKSGIGKNILGQEVNNILYTSSDISLSSGTSQSIVSNQNLLIFNSQDSFQDGSSFEGPINQGDLQQQFDYIQLPLEMSYSLLKEPRYTMSLGIGGNINFLTNNRAFIDNEQIGESLGVSNTIFGATINSNVSYKLEKNMSLFVEPSYNYFEKPINNNNQAFQNTQLRVLFGLQYKF